jgi:predicted hotdog family 3-hydroxylacyl-ACP dehydratase
MRLNRAWIEQHIPHQGRMCLLEEVLDWSPDKIRCRIAPPFSVDHPLRAHGRLGAAAGVELAGQTMAVHAALLADGTEAAPRAGFLASLRGVRMHVLRLDDVQGELICDAVRLAGDGGTAVYQFELRAMTKCLMSGRATVVLDADKAPGT